MTSRDRRDELREQYEQRPRQAGVYAIRNTATGRVLVASSVDLASVRNRLEFGQTTNSTGVLDRRMVPDARKHGMGSFVFEILDTLDDDPTREAAQTTKDLGALEQLWREKLGTEPNY